MTINKAILVGNLGQDPELRNTAGGTAVANLRLATNERRKSGEEWVDHTEWHTIVAFGKTAENVGKYCKKGKQIYVEGRIQTRKWQDKEGKDRYSTEIVADSIRFLGSKQDGASEGAGGGEEKPDQSLSTAPSGSARLPDMDPEIPFAMLIGLGAGALAAAAASLMQALPVFA